jgi:peptide deformylase
MAIRTILELGDPELRRIAEPLALDELARPDWQAFIDDLVATMRHANGAGLAATQVGVHRRIVALEVGDNPRYPYKPRIPLTIAINPELEPLGEETFDNYEGCLSVPGLRGKVRRHRRLRVRWLDRRGERHEQVMEGLTAGTWQHECDHLDGVLFVDRVTDPHTLTTWENFGRFHRDAFVASLGELARKEG